mgnify:CR=1 FL=1
MSHGALAAGLVGGDGSKGKGSRGKLSKKKSTVVTKGSGRVVGGSSKGRGAGKRATSSGPGQLKKNIQRNQAMKGGQAGRVAGNPLAGYPRATVQVSVCLARSDLTSMCPCVHWFVVVSRYVIVCV